MNITSQIFIIAVLICSTHKSFLAEHSLFLQPDIEKTPEVLDLQRMQFSAGPRMIVPRQGCAVARIDAYRIMVVGGSNGALCHDSTEILDVRTMRFTAGPSV